MKDVNENKQQFIRIISEKLEIKRNLNEKLQRQWRTIKNIKTVIRTNKIINNYLNLLIIIFISLK